MLISISRFHTTAFCGQLPSHPLYISIDWARVSGGMFAVVDPMDPAAILYLSERDYKRQVRVSISQDFPLVVLARAGEVRAPTRPTKSPTSTSEPEKDSSDSSDGSNQNSPPKGVTVVDSEGAPLFSWIPETKFPSPNRPGYSDLGTPERNDWWTKCTSAEDGTPLSLEFPGHTEEEINRFLPKRGKGRRDPWKFLNWHLSRLRKTLNPKILAEGDALVSLTPEKVLTLVLGWGIDSNYRLGGPLEPTPALRKALLRLGEDLVRILKTRGRQALILKMKNSLFFLNRWLAGQQNTNPFLLGEPVGLARSGLPKIIPLYFRRMIGQRNVSAIRLIQTILKSYSAFKGTHEPSDLSTVTGPEPPLDEDFLKDFGEFCQKEFWFKIVRQNGREAGFKDILGPDFKLPDDGQPPFPVRAGPNAPVAILGAAKDAIAWAGCPHNWPMEWAEHVGDKRTIRLFEETLQAGLAWREVAGETSVSYHTGCVAMIPEAAGKVRTIAIVDYWTQRLMKPVHDWMMKVLSVLPTDGTFDQNESLRSYVAFCKASGITKHYSIDLKSATDLIPLTLYEVCLKALLRERTVDLWLSLAADRWFAVPESELIQNHLHGREIRYNRGQPMGMLSSWPAMGIVHHALVLFAAKLAGKNPREFWAYRVLGDDNVTGDCQVASKYLEVCERLSVPTSPAKTLEGSLFIFASQVYLGDINISPLSLKEELSVATGRQRVEMALRAFSRGWTEHGSVARFLRLLIPLKCYTSAIRQFSRGKLGTIVQTALVSAFGTSGRLLERLGFRGSGSKPFLLALQDRVEALAGDRGHLDRRTSELLPEIEVDLAIDIVRRAIRLLDVQLDQLKSSRTNFSKWGNGLVRWGILPTQVHKNLFGVEPFFGLGNSRRGWLETSLEHKALWPIVKDTFVPFFGDCWQRESTAQELRAEVLAKNPSFRQFLLDSGFDPDKLEFPPDLDLSTLGFEDGEDLEGEEDPPLPDEYFDSALLLRTAGFSAGGSVNRIFNAYRGKGVHHMAQSGVPPELDRESAVTSKCAEVRARAREILDALVQGLPEADPLVGGPWPLVDEVFAGIAKIPRLPSFETVQSLSPSRDPKSVALLQSWVRQVTAYNQVMRYLPLGTDFQYAYVDAPDAFLACEEAVRQTSTRKVSVPKGSKGSPKPSRS